jgi:hypothetical protein
VLVLRWSRVRTKISSQQAANQEQGIVVPLELAGLLILKQEVQIDATILVEVKGAYKRAIF